MATESIHFPGLGFAHSPQLDLTIIGCRSQERESRMETSPVDSTVMSFQDVLDNDVVGSKQFRLHIHRCRGSGTAARHRIHHGIPHLFLAQTSSVPDSDSLIQTSRHNQVFRGMEGSTHNVVIVSRQNAQARALVKVPQTESLIVGRAQNPRELRRVRMELNSSDVIQVSQQCEKTSSELVVPYFDFVIVTAGDNQRLVEVKIHTSNGSFVLFESINHRSNAVVP
mmetsp:Transcript_61092/g.171174  ORF Transcript_61092/g.171174 Transcript_61092/m.171174 type:complete len:225 (+) Transcript_61092:1764-2438(+)